MLVSVLQLTNIKYMKKLILIGLGFATLSANAIDVSVVATNNDSLAIPSYTNVVSGRAQIQLISLVNPNNLAFSSFLLIDAPAGVTNVLGASGASRWTNYVTNASGLIGYSNGPYASIVSFTTNIPVYATNSMGLTNFQGVGPTNAAGNYFYTNNPVFKSNVLWTATNTIGGTIGTTNAYRVLFSGSLGALATLTITNQFNVIYGLGIVLPNLSTSTVNITYSSGL